MARNGIANIRLCQACEKGFQHLTQHDAAWICENCWHYCPDGLYCKAEPLPGCEDNHGSSELRWKNKE